MPFMKELSIFLGFYSSNVTLFIQSQCTTPTSRNKANKSLSLICNHLATNKTASTTLHQELRLNHRVIISTHLSGQHNTNLRLPNQKTLACCYWFNAIKLIIPYSISIIKWRAIFLLFTYPLPWYLELWTNWKRASKNKNQGPQAC